MRFSSFLAASAAIAAVFAYACSSSDDTTTPTTTPDAAAPDSAAPTTDAGADFSAPCATLANAFCQKLASCGTFSLQKRYADMNACLTRETLQCTTAYGAPDTNRTPTNTAECAAAYTSADCTDILTGTTPAACLATTHPGNRALGASCAVAAQCQSGYCTAPRGQACGTCTAAGPAVGDICPESCGVGQYCNRATGQCTELSKVGDPCDETLACQQNLSCVGSSVVDGGITQGKCQVPATIANAACDTSTSDGTGCATEDGLTCSKKVCVQGTIATTGETCGATTPVLTFCSGGSACNNTQGQTGTCIGPIPDGAACDTSTVATCLPGSICIGTATGGKINGTCQVRSAAVCN